jgi:hypothetical protein
MAITISPALEAKLRVRAEAAGLTVESLIERIADDDQSAEAELEALAIEGLESGEPVPGDDHFWDEKRQRLVDRRAASNAK